MAQDLISVKSCDKHSEQGETVAGVAAEDQGQVSGLLTEEAKTTILTVPIGFDGVWKTLDWCPQCLAEIVALRRLWDEAGIDIDPPRRGPGKPSPKGSARPGRKTDNPQDKQCLWCVESYAADTGLSGHLERQHGLPKSLREVFGIQCPLCGDKHNGLGGHTIRAHNVNVSQAFVRARGQGDPFGVVAKVMAKAS